MPQLTWTVLYTPWGMLSKNLAWWQPDNSIHLIYPLDSADLPWQSIMLTISFPPGCGGRGRYTRGVQQLASSPRHSWTECTCGLGPRQPHVLTLSKHLLRGADISICPVEKRERRVWHSSSAGMHVCVHAWECVFFLCYVWALMCIVLFFTLAWWPGKSLPKGSEMLRRTRRRKLMDLYQAVKIDNCHSSSGCLEVNPDQQGLATHGSHGAYKSQHATVSFGCP